MSFIEEWNSEIPEYAGVEHGSLAASWNPNGSRGTESLEIVHKGSESFLFVSLEDLRGLIKEIDNYDC